MASSDDPGTDHALSPDGEQGEYVRDPWIVSADEGRFPRPNPDLRPHSPSFVRDRSFTLGTPSGEVLFRRSNRYENVGEPAQEPFVHFAQTQNFQSGNNNKSDELRKQISSIQASLSAIRTRLGNQNVGPDAVNVSYGPLPTRSASVPSQFPNRMHMISDSNDVNDRYATVLGRERSLSPRRFISETSPNFSVPISAPVNVNYGYRSSDFIKVAMYDGKSSWKDYFVQFELAAQASGWDRNTHAIRLACSLRGSAQALLSDLTPEIRQNYDRLVTTLTERFEPENQCGLYKAQLKHRIRKRDEGLPELAQDIKRLTRIA